jgi:hypothetical protein
MKTHRNAYAALKNAAQQLCPSAKTIHDLDPNGLIMKETEIADEAGKKVKIEMWYLDETGFKSAEVYYLEKDIDDLISKHQQNQNQRSS